MVQLHMFNARLAAYFECDSSAVLADEPCCFSDWNELVGTDHLALVAGQPEQGFDAGNLSAFHVNDRLVVQHWLSRREARLQCFLSDGLPTSPSESM